jgi:hypothetical protein
MQSGEYSSLLWDVAMNIVVSWDVISCSLVDCYQRCLHLQGKVIT